MEHQINTLYKLYKEEFSINEGLILTYPLHKVFNILKDKYVIIPDFNKNTFFISFIFDVNTNKSLEELHKILVQTNNLGWFPSTLYGYPNAQDDHLVLYLKYNLENFKELIQAKYNYITIVFEAKYDIPIKNIPKIIYHLTPKDNYKKILKQGLVPKSRSKNSYHPERVYLAKNKEDLYDLANLINTKLEDNIEDWIILEINTSIIPQYFKIYKDPNFFERGYYSLNYIPPVSISYLEEFKTT